MMSEQRGTTLDSAARKFDHLWERAYDATVGRSFASRHATIKEAMLFHLRDAEANMPLVFYQDKVLTRLQVDEDACRLGNALLDARMQKGDRVSIVVSNRPEVVVAFAACYKTGLIAAAYNQRCTSHEIVHSLADVESSALIIESATLPKVLPAVQEGRLPRLKLIVVVDGEKNDGGSDGEGLRIVGYETSLAAADASEPPVDVQPGDGAILLFTGGTTGVSKGCCQTHGRMALELESMCHWVSSAITTPNPRFLVCMPMTHIMGINYGVNWQLINGGCVAIGTGTKPLDIVASFERYQPTVWAALPTLLHSVCDSEALAKGAYRNLELVVFGGSFIARETLENLISKTKARFVESYGMSESFGFVTCNPVGSMGKIGAIGLPISNTDVLVVDAMDGSRALSPGERGEIVFRGPQIIQEYWNNPGETRIALRNGWLYSGDIGYMDADGFFYLVDRKKDTIVVSGFNVFPKEVDEILIAHPAVADACTIGVPDSHSGERPKSFVVLKGGIQISADELIAYCREYLAAYKVPKYMEFIDEIPKTKARKPDRERLKQREQPARKASEFMKKEA